MGVAVGGKNLEYAVTKLEDGDIKGTAAKVIHCNFHILVLLVKAVCKGCSRGLVDDTLHIKACNSAGFLSCLTLGVGEVCGNSDNGLCNFLTEIFFGGLFHLLENHGRNFLGSIELAVDVYTGSVVFSADNLIRYAGNFCVHLVIRFTHETLDGEHCVVRIGDGLTLCGRAYLTLTAVCESHH